MILLLACHQPDEKRPDPTTDDTGVTEAPVCDPAELPVESELMRGYTGAEDFAFDADGYMVSIDAYGNLVGIAQSGDQKLILADATPYGAGTRLLPDGDIVFADASEGSLMRVDPATGSSTVVLSGLAYPNGLDVGLDGYVYVSEQIAGRVRRVDPDTGDWTVAAAGLYNPNGVTFSPDYGTMYVGSFGGGTVWATDGAGEEWSDPRIVATTPESPGVPPNWCDGHAVGDECPLNGGYGLGGCADDGRGGLYCGENLDYTACDGLAAGDACTTTRLGSVVKQICMEGGDGLFCPRTDVAYTEPCDGAETKETCTVGMDDGFCYPTWEGESACYLRGSDTYTAGCEGLAEGDACVVDDTHYPSMGTCESGSAWGMAGLVCWPAGMSTSNRGGLDGINVDACGNLYVTEYIEGTVWRFTEENAEAEVVARLRADWIPNMHWGNGIGGWEKDVLYVSDRTHAGMYALDVGVEGHPDAYRP